MKKITVEILLENQDQQNINDLLNDLHNVHNLNKGNKNEMINQVNGILKELCKVKVGTSMRKVKWLIPMEIL